MRSFEEWMAVRRLSLAPIVIASLILVSCAPTTSRSRSEASAEPDSVRVAELPAGVASALLIGSALLESGDPGAALPYFQRAHEAAPGDLALGLRYADLALEVGRPKEALGVLQTLSATHSKDSEVGLRRLRIFLGLGELEKARALSGELIAAHPENSEALRLRAAVLEQDEDYTAALELYSRLLEVEGPSVGLYGHLAVLHTRMGDVDGAAQAFEASLHLDAENPIALEMLGAIRLEQSQMESYESFVRSLCAEQPVAAAPRRSLADLHLAAGRVDEAAELLLQLDAEGSLGWGPRMVLADLLARLDRVDEASDLVDELVEEGHDSALLYRIGGAIAQSREDLEAAEDWYRRAVKADSGDREALLALLMVKGERYPTLFNGGQERSAERNEFHRLLTRARGMEGEAELRFDYLVGTMLRRSGRPGEALSHLERALSVAPDEADVLYDIAICLEELERDSEAVEVLERLLIAAPGEAIYINFLGYLLAEQGWQLPRAEELIRTALADDPENAFYRDSLGWVFFQTGRYEEARVELFRALDGLGEDVTVLEHAGDALRALERGDEAVEMYRRALEAGGDPERLKARISDIEGSSIENR